jgi:hypothetical protein
MRRARSPREFAAKVHIVLEEADECVLWLQVVNGIIPGLAGLDRLLSEATELRNLFARSESSARHRVSRSR